MDAVDHYLKLRQIFIKQNQTQFYNVRFLKWIKVWSIKPYHLIVNRLNLGWLYSIDYYQSKVLFYNSEIFAPNLVT